MNTRNSEIVAAGSLDGFFVSFAGKTHIVSTTRNSALPLIMRAYASAAFSSG